MGSAVPAIRERRSPKRRVGVPTSYRSGLPRKGRSARSLRHSGVPRRRGRRLAVFLALLFAFGVGYSIVGLAEERTASSVGPYTPTANFSKDKMPKTPASSATCGDLGVLVDRSHSLPPDYMPKNLVPLREYGIPTLGSEVLRREAAEHLGRLVQDAAEDGEKLVVASAYRSYEQQQRSHRSLKGILGADAGRLSATPGSTGSFWPIQEANRSGPASGGSLGTTATWAPGTRNGSKIAARAYKSSWSVWGLGPAADFST